MEDPQMPAWSRCCGEQRLCHGGAVCAVSAALGVDAVPAHGQRLRGSVAMKQLFLAAACSWRKRQRDVQLQRVHLASGRVSLSCSSGVPSVVGPATERGSSPTPPGTPPASTKTYCLAAKRS